MGVGSNSDIELLAGLQGGGSLSGASGRRIRHELENIINRINKNPAGVKLTLSKNAETLFRQDIAKAVSSVKIESFDTTTAVAKLKADVQAAFTGVAIPIGAATVGAAAASAAAAQTQSTTAQAMSSAEIEAMDKSVKSLNRRLSLLNRRIIAIKNSATGGGEEVSRIISAVDGGSSGSRSSSSSVATAQQISTLTRRAETLLKNNSRIVGTGYGDRVNSILKDLQAESISTNAFKNLKNDLAQVELGLKNAGLQGKTFWSVLKSGYEKFGGWALITRSMMAAVNAVRNMIDNVTALDTAMVELRKVTDETDSTYEKFFADATVRARNLGATVADTINATADFSRLGYSIEDAATLADTAIMYKNVGDGISDIGVASQSIISTLKGFNLEAENATHVIDAFNEVGNNFAISSAGIGDALTRSAASLSAANNTMEESIALITAMNTTLQDPEKVGTTLKTITMYLRAAKAELEDAGEDTEGMAISTSKLRESILALTSNRVDIMLDDTTFKSTYQIIKEISQAWSSMADVDQAALLELLGGKRNANATASLIANFDVAEQALKSATDSAGSAAAENEKYLDSILGKVAQFNAAFETLSATVIDADFSKGVVDTGTTILDTITKLIDGLGTLNTLAMGAGAALSLGKVNSIFSPVQFGVEANPNGGDFTKNFSIGFTSQLSRDKAGIDAYNEALKTFKGECRAAGEDVTKLNEATAKFEKATNDAKVAVSSTAAQMIDADRKTRDATNVQEDNAIGINNSTKSLIGFRAKTIAATVATTALNMAISLGLSIAIQALVTGLDYLINREERIAEAAAEATEAISEMGTEFKDLKGSTDDALSTIKAFYKGANEGTLSSEQAEAYSNAIKELTEQYPSLISGYDAEGNALIDLSHGYDALADSVTAAYNAKLALANIDLDDKMDDIIKNADVKVSKLKAQLNNADRMAGIYSEFLSSLPSSVSISKNGRVDLKDILPDNKEVATAIRAAIVADGGEWFKINGYQDVDVTSYIQHEDPTRGMFRLNLGEIKSGQRRVDEKAISDYISSVVGGSLQNYKAEAENLKAQIPAIWSSVSSSLQTYLQTDPSFMALNDYAKTAVSGMITNIDWSSALGDKSVTWDRIKDFVQDGLISVFSAPDSQISDAVKRNISGFISGSIQSLSPEDIKSAYGEIEQALETYLGEGSSEFKAIMSSIDMSFDIDLDNLDSSLSAAKDRLVDAMSAFDDGSESTENANAALDTFIASLDEMSYAELENFINFVNEDGNLALTFDGWTASWEEYNRNMLQAKGLDSARSQIGLFAEQAGVLADSLNKLGIAATEEQIGQEEYGYAYEQKTAKIKELQALADAGKTGGHAYKQLASGFGIDMGQSVAEQIAQINELSKLYTDGADGLDLFLSKVQEANASGLLDEGVASVIKLEDGTLDFRYDINQIEAFGKAMGMTSAQILEFIDLFKLYSQDFHEGSAQEYDTMFRDAGLYIADASVSMRELMAYTGKSEAEVKQLVEDINELRAEKGEVPLELIVDESGVSDLKRILEKEGIATSVRIKGDVETFVLDQFVIDSMKQQISAAYKEAMGVEIPTDELTARVVEMVKKCQTICPSLEIPADVKIGDQNLLSLLNGTGLDDDTINKAVSILYEDGCDKSLEAMLGKWALLRSEPDIRKQITTTYVEKHISQNNGQKRAKGTSNAYRGYALLGDEPSPDGSPRPELVVSKRGAYLAGINGPTVGYLNEHDQVFTYSQTKEILKGRNFSGTIPAFRDGSGGTYRSKSSIGAGSLWSSVASSSNSFAAGSDFESLYKYHQHLLKMEQESQKDYLDWLNKAYKDAYARGEIELDDYYKYQEEVFSLIREIVQDNLNDAEHYIDMLGHYDGNEKQIIAIYKDLMSAIEKEIASARAAGLDDNDEYIQNLQKQWWSYHDEIIDIQDEISDNVKDSLEDLIDLRIKMIKQDLKDEKEALKDKKDYLKDFYDDQKEMLQDAYDEEKYLEEQAEKRKAVSDLQMQLNQLEYDDSAWAQKKRLELLQELRDAQKELNDFEKDYALEKAQELLDDTYDAQEKEIDDEIELIEEKEDHAKNLREQAISDLQAADRQMYLDMIEWNAKYGDGIDATITEKWENATKAMSDYYKLNQEYYEGIDISKGVYPDFLPKSDSWSSSPISGDNPANQKKPANSGGSTGKAGSVSGIGPQLSYGSRGDDVKALQTALKNMGLYADSIDGKFGPNTRAAVMAFQRKKGISVDGIVGPNTKKMFKEEGYASGTRNAIAGLHEIWEKGSEYVFTSSNGKRYRMFSNGDKVLNANATNFLYDFANSGGKVIETIVNNLMSSSKLAAVNSPSCSPIVNMGDIIVQGSVSERTVSEIRRAQREQVNTLLKEFGRLRQ